MYSERPALSFKKDMISIENGVNLKRLRCALVEGNMSSVLFKASCLALSSTRRKGCGLNERLKWN